MYYFFVAGKFLVIILPLWASYFIAKVLALAWFCFFPKDGNSVYYNLEPVVKDKKKRHIAARDVFVNFSYYLVDFFRYAKLDKRFIEKYVTISGRDNLERCLSSSKGVILLAAHLGNYELGGAVMALLGYPFYAVALAHKDKRTNEFFNRQRRRVGIGVISTGAAVRNCFSLLRQGKIVAFLGDRDFSSEGIDLKLFSRSVCLPRGPAHFAFKTGAYILPSFFVRKNKWFYQLVFEEPISFRADDYSGYSCRQKEKLLVKKYIPVLEKYIEKYPEQWYMFRKYWREESFLF